jgi:hypothetical protein
MQATKLCDAVNCLYFGLVVYFGCPGQHWIGCSGRIEVKQSKSLFLLGRDLLVLAGLSGVGDKGVLRTTAIRPHTGNLDKKKRQKPALGRTGGSKFFSQ